MCGIVGYVGPKDAREVVIEGLRRLEYRGYDSAGVAVLADGELSTAKKAGKLANLEKVLAEHPLPAATIGIGHTRWATHGGPTDRNAHPHVSADGSVAVIHNGIIENFAELRAEIEATGVEFTSDTDTEVAAHLLAAVYAELPDGPGRLAEAMRRVSRRLEGAFTLVATHAAEPDTLVAARRSSPLVVGVGDGEYFLGSDVAAFIAHTREARELGQDQVVEIDRTRGLTVTDFAGEPVEPTAYTVDWDAAAAEKGGYDWFMLKEIAEQPQAVADTLLGRLGRHGELMLDEVRLSDQELRDVDKIFVVACGTAYHAGLIAKYAIEHWTRIPVEVEVASEFRYRDPVLDRSTLVVVISQSGETMDTLMALRHAREQRAKRPGHLQRQRLDDPARVRRRPLHARRAGDRRRLHQGLPDPAGGLLPRRAVPRPGARHQVRGRGRLDRRRPAPPARGRGRGARRHGAGARAGPLARRPGDDPLPGPARRFPGGARGRAEAQGAGLHPRGGLRRRRAQARARSPSSTRARRSSSWCPRRAAASRCTARSSPTSRRSVPAGPGRS